MCLSCSACRTKCSVRSGTDRGGGSPRMRRAADNLVVGEDCGRTGGRGRVEERDWWVGGCRSRTEELDRGVGRRSRMGWQTISHCRTPIAVSQFKRLVREQTEFSRFDWIQSVGNGAICRCSWFWRPDSFWAYCNIRLGYTRWLLKVSENAGLFNFWMKNCLKQTEWPDDNNASGH